MNFNRTKNAKRNIGFGIINRVVTILLPFIVRTAIIYTLGVQYLGLNSLFSSILQVLNLAELGFGEAIVYSMYKPISEGDGEKISSLLNAFRKIYFLVGVIIAAVGLAMMPFLPYLIHGSYPKELNLHILYLIYLGNTVISYWLFAYKSSLLQALQRNDVVSKIDIIIKVLLNSLQFFSLFLFKDYYIFLVIMPFCTIISNLYTSHYVDKHFSQYVCKGKISKDEKDSIKHNVIGLSVSKVCSISRNSLDSIFISSFLGLTVTAIYANYYYVMNAVTMLLVILVNSLCSVVGNSIAQDSKKKNYDDMIKLNFIYMWIASWATTCLFCLYQPFMVLWVGRDYLLDLPTVALLCSYFYALKTGDVRTIFVQGSGLYWQQRFRALGEALCNITLNWIFVQTMGIFGVILATLVSLLFFNFYLSTKILFRYYFDEFSPKEFYLQHLVNFGITIVTVTITFFLTNTLPISGIIGFVIKAVISMLTPVIIWVLLLNNTAIYQNSMKWILKKLNLLKVKKIFLVK